MLQRCNNPNNPDYRKYGGRGIAVCAQWRRFESFYADMGERPAGMSIERKDVNGAYEPSNCVWATKTQQNRNTRLTRFPGRAAHCVRWLYEMGYVQTRIARMFETTQGNISKVVLGRTWTP